MNNEILNSKEVAKMLGISRATLWRLRTNNDSQCSNPFPKPIQITVRLIGWEKHVLDNWLKEQRKQLH
ncbi:AlpA family phage regulatory protein [Psychrosphaera haliotis]|uniref:AlpA family phage regulatory protein n=1 Tax=Psychrosphaera haliotis TaxID=555083 RepID=A0A6N8F9G4_9GAMM|nr:AlpA family phage regulatory protein [Psychrosphaera haliotis]